MKTLCFTVCSRSLRAAAAVGFLLALAPCAPAQSLAPAFSSNYALSNLGSVPGVPMNYGGITLLAGDPNTLLIGGNANGAGGAIYSVGLTRDVNGHINGFSGPATFFSTAPYIDGGLAYGPGGALLYTAYPTNTLGEIKPGSTSPDKLVDLSVLGIVASVGTLTFVPAGFPGEGGLRIASYGNNGLYSATLTMDGSGTYLVSDATLQGTAGIGPEGIVYVPAGSPAFSAPSMLVSEYGANRVSAYALDANGYPINATRQDFITGLNGSEGAFIDPQTGDFLFSTFGSSNSLIEVQGFAAVVPEPSTWLGGLGVMALLSLAWRRQRARPA